MRAASKIVLPISLAVVTVLAGSASARAEEAKEMPHARVSFTEGDFFVRGPFDSEEQNLTLNSIIREGDIVRAADNTLGEIELPGENFLRLAANSVARVDRIGASIEVSVMEGAAYLSHGRGGDAVVNTKMGGVGLGPSSVVRVEAARVDQTMVARVASGTAEASCQDAAVKLQKGDTYTCGQGLAQRGQWDIAKGDAFDRWNAEREEHVRHYSAAPPEVAGKYEGLYDLEGNGTWVYVDNGWYWQPTVVVTDWRPYYDGYWNWYGPIGWTWVPYAPWGYVTHHYGRWIWRGGYGWMWSPAPVFAGAWVVWGSFGGYLGWAPCDFWGRPIVATARYTYYDSAVWSFGHSRYFYAGGGNYLGRGYAARNADVVGVVSAAGHERPFFTMGHEQISQLRASPIRDPHIALAPKIAGDRPSIARAGSRAAILSSMQPTATRPGPLLSRLAEQERLPIQGAQRSVDLTRTAPSQHPGIGAGAEAHGFTPAQRVTGAQSSGIAPAHERAEPSFTRPSFTRQQPIESRHQRLDTFNRWSADRARSQADTLEHESVGGGGYVRSGAAEPRIEHQATMSAPQGSGASSGFHPSTTVRESSGFGHSFGSTPSFGQHPSMSQPSSGFHPSGGGSGGHSYSAPSFSKPSFSAPVSRPSGGGGRRR